MFVCFCSLDYQIMMLVVVRCNKNRVNLWVCKECLVALIALEPLADIIELRLVPIGESNQLNARKILQHLFVLMSHKSMADNGQMYYICHLELLSDCFSIDPLYILVMLKPVLFSYDSAFSSVAFSAS